jgi:hypothetical protein
LALQEKAVRAHHALLSQLAEWLKEHGWRGIEEIEAAVDLWARRGTAQSRVIFEVKTLRVGSETARVRGAIGQLLEYRYFDGKDDDDLCVVTSRPIADFRCRMLDALGIGVLWKDGRTFRAGSWIGAKIVGVDGA